MGDCAETGTGRVIGQLIWRFLNPLGPVASSCVPLCPVVPPPAGCQCHHLVPAVARMNRAGRLARASQSPGPAPERKLSPAQHNTSSTAHPQRHRDTEIHRDLLGDQGNTRHDPTALTSLHPQLDRSAHGSEIAAGSRSRLKASSIVFAQSERRLPERSRHRP